MTSSTKALPICCRAPLSLQPSHLRHRLLFIRNNISKMMDLVDVAATRQSPDVEGALEPP